MKKEIQILFIGMMVSAILPGLKTMTRRTRGLEIVNEDPDFYRWLKDYDQLDIPREAKHYDDKFYYAFTGKYNNSGLVVTTCPYGKPGDLLWVKETFTVLGWHKDSHYVDLKREDSTYDTVHLTDQEWQKFERWQRKAGRHSSLFMFKSLSRIWLRVNSVRPERLHDITERDAIDEGVFTLGDEFLSKYFEPYWYNYQEWLKRKQGGVIEKPPVGPAPSARFEALWKQINGWASWEQNPWVWVVSFKVLSTTGRPAIITSNQSSPIQSK